MRRFAVSDIHGCHKTFRNLLDRLALTRDDELYLLGDFIDRGPGSKQVIDTVLALADDGYCVSSLMGNHEYAFLRALSEASFYDTWENGYGGKATMDSYDAGRIPEAHLEWIGNLSFYLSVEDYFFVHAGLNFRTPDPLKDPASMLYIRNWYDELDRSWLGNRILVHGHTPIAKEAILRQRDSLDYLPALNIDAGCVYAGIRPGLGYLCAFDLDSLELYFVENTDLAVTPVT